MNDFSLFEVGLVMLGMGLVALFIASISMLIAAFRVHAGWGIGLFCFPPLTLLFLLLRWEDARRPFFRSLAGMVLMSGGVALAGYAHHAGLTGVMHGHAARWLSRYITIMAEEDAGAGDADDGEAHQPVAPERTFIGRHIDAVIAEYGFPRVRLEAGETIFLRYADWEFEADREGIVFLAEPIAGEE